MGLIMFQPFLATICSLRLSYWQHLEQELNEPCFRKDKVFQATPPTTLSARSALSVLLNASLNRPVSLRAETANMPATSVALHLLLRPAYVGPQPAFAQEKKKASHCFAQYCALSLKSCSNLLFKLFCTLLFEFFVLCAWDLMMYSFLFPPSSCFFNLSSLSLSLSLCAPLALSCVAQSLLVPGKSPSKYGRRGSAIGIGTIEEVDAYLSLSFIPLFTHVVSGLYFALGSILQLGCVCFSSCGCERFSYLQM